uniref:Glycosyltransferase family 2 protein n=1 Tax=Prevotella sp. GTC17259 TaxID=3236795 RepID=A0AB33J5M8_9BACT
MITVFTPTYNRADLLRRLYQSLKAQTDKDFEWLIVDDGSTDTTADVVHLMIEESLFPIRYIYKSNGGKHTAINRGVKEAAGELFFIADSDDCLPVNALQDVRFAWMSVEDKYNYAGVCGLDGKLGTEDIIGSGFNHLDRLQQLDMNGHRVSYIDGTNIEIRYCKRLTGDMKEVFRTDVLREFSFPEIEGEKFCPEVLVWNRIARKYKLRYFDKVIYLAEYQEGGLTDCITRARMESPVASALTYQEIMTYDDIPVIQKAKSAINYWRFRMCKKAGDGQIPQLAWYWNVMMPFGWLMHKRDLQVVKRK